MKILNHEIIGRFVVKWSGLAPADRPKTVLELQTHMNADGAIMQGLDWSDVIEFDPGEEFVMYYDLPDPGPKTVRFAVPMRGDMTDPAPTGEYDLPKGYQIIAFDGADLADLDATKAEKFRHVRIGDYTTAKCK